MKPKSFSILIIDPYLKEPAGLAISNLNFLISELRLELKIPLHSELFFPIQGKYSLKDYLDSRSTFSKLSCVISLGSYANISENLPWVENLGIQLKECILEKGVPFLGICFSHQLLAHIYGGDVGIIKNREMLPKNKYDEFRKIYVVPSTISKAFTQKSEFISKARHEEEVKNIPNDLECFLTSDSCKIEGLLHKRFPTISVQSHPEEYHESEESWNFLKDVLRYLLSIGMKV